MGNYSFYVASPDGVIRENPLQAPLDVVQESYPEGTLILRFGLDQDNNVIFLQDTSFQEKVNDGDEGAWDLVNRALEAIEAKTGLRFPSREHGEPADSAIMRNLSDYQDAWDKISNFMGEELGFMKELLETSKVRPVIDRRYPLSEVAEALRYLEDGHARGKVVITTQ